MPKRFNSLPVFLVSSANTKSQLDKTSIARDEISLILPMGVEIKYSIRTYYDICYKKSKFEPLKFDTSLLVCASTL